MVNALLEQIGAGGDSLTEIDRARAKVAAFAADPDNATRWYTNIASVELETTPPLTAGSRMRLVAGFLGRPRRDCRTQPTATGLSGSVIQSLHEPMYTSVPPVMRATLRARARWVA